MARGLPLLCLLISLGSRHVTAEDILETVCRADIDACETTFVAEEVGSQVAKVCPAFEEFQICYYAHIKECNVEEAKGFEVMFNKVIMRLPSGCTVSTTPHDFFASSLGEGSSASQGSYPSSSASVLPPSGTSGGPAMGSSFLYMNSWQWLILLSCLLCCCLGGGIAACSSQRRRNRMGPYGRQQRGACDDDDEDAYMYPAPAVGGYPAPYHQDVQQVYPLMQQSYAMPTQQYVASPAMPAQFATAALPTQFTSAAMPTQFNGMVAPQSMVRPAGYF